MPLSRSLFAAVLLVGLALVAGCGTKGPARGTVKGRVTLGDKAVTGATVMFENPETGVAVLAQLDADGNYEVKTHQGDGLPAGNYKVAVTPGGIMSPDEANPMADKAKIARPKLNVTIPEPYLKTATSKLTADVKPGDNPPFDFKLTP